MPRKSRRQSVDEEIDVAVFQVLHALRGLSAAKAAANAGVCTSTIYKLRRGPKYGGTRYPRFRTLRELAKSVGLSFQLVTESGRKATWDESLTEEIAHDQADAAERRRQRQKSALRKAPRDAGSAVRAAIEVRAAVERLRASP